MNENTEELTRNRWDFILFGVAFFGFVLAAGGLVVNSIPGSLTGAGLLLLSLVCFLFRGSDSE
jgi:hypothetical protein